MLPIVLLFYWFIGFWTRILKCENLFGSSYDTADDQKKRKRRRRKENGHSSIHLHWTEPPNCISEFCVVLKTIGLRRPFCIRREYVSIGTLGPAIQVSVEYRLRSLSSSVYKGLTFRRYMPDKATKRASRGQKRGKDDDIDQNSAYLRRTHYVLPYDI